MKVVRAHSSPADGLEQLGAYARQIDSGLRRAVSARARSEHKKLYGMLAYALGFLDAKDVPLKVAASGKRFRPALCLLIAEGYGVRKGSIDAAVAIELFHTFSLIHDDVEDRDEVRRNRPTVWKVWGVNHAINAGDVQSLLVSEVCSRIAGTGASGQKLSSALLSAFINVCEGQYLDFALSEVPLGSSYVNEERYILMTELKTGALVGVAAEAAGIVAGKGSKERKQLQVYGRALGTAFQLVDDYRSIWATRRETHKDTHSDIRELKRTLPIIVTYAHSTRRARARLKHLYGLSRQLTAREIHEVRALIDATDARAYLLSCIKRYAQTARFAAEKLALPEAKKRILSALIDSLVPEAVAAGEVQ